MKYDKYAFYEASVQSPGPHIEWVVRVYKELTGKFAHHLREDFCGTFQLACEWVRRNRANTAVGLDLDPEPLAYGKKHHLSTLNAEQKSRLKVLRRNVLSVTAPADVVLAGNFSFFIFKERQLLIDYFKKVRLSLHKGGIAMMEMAGGPGMIEDVRERKKVKLADQGTFTYTWDQKSYDPITHDANYAIHFKLPNGREIRDAFTYDWRLWTIPEVREAMHEAGYRATHVYWETEHKGEGTGEYVRAEHGDNAYSWIAYVVGVR